MRFRLLILLAAASTAVLAAAVFLTKSPPSAAPAAGASAFAVTQAASGPLPPDQAQPDHYRDRIAHLRAMKYPEEAIRSTVVDDIANVYRSKEMRIEASVRAGTMDSNAAQAATAGLENEKERLLGVLFGDRQAGGGFSPDAGGVLASNQEAAVVAPAQPWWGDPVQGAGAGAQQSSPAKIPAALVPPDPNWHLTDSQTAAWQQIANDFTTAVGNGSQDTSSTEYLQLWDSAQSIADQTFKQQFGWQAFNGQELRAAAALNSQ